MNYYTSVIFIILMALAVLSILIQENNRIPKRKKQLFILTNIMVGIAAAAECVGLHIGGNEAVPEGVLAFVKAVDYTFTPMTGGVLIALLDDNSRHNRLLTGIFALNAAFQIVSAFMGWMIEIDEHNYYVHGSLYPVYMILYLCIIILLAIKMAVYGKTFRKQNRFSLYSAMVLILSGIAIQELLGNEYRVAYLGLAFGVGFLFIHYSEFSQLKLDETITDQREKISLDPLTGVFSRNAYSEVLKEYEAGIPDELAVVLIDINGLKDVNDSLGHDAGDELIQGAAGCIREAFGGENRVFRIGGDEFVVFGEMPEAEVRSSIIKLKDRTARWSGKLAPSLSLSVGCALTKDYRELSVAELVKTADSEMYQQKKEYYEAAGNNRRRH
ncbi:MAG: GGDEF domain-containing protein [Lentihominibacter sp.]